MGDYTRKVVLVKGTPQKVIRLKFYNDFLPGEWSDLLCTLLKEFKPIYEIPDYFQSIIP